MTEDGKGIAPLVRLIGAGRDLTGFSAADKIVGKAAAMLFIKAKVCAVYGQVMTDEARTLLLAGGITCRSGELTEKIINRKGTDLCPMEKAVAALQDPEEAFAVIRQKLADLRKSSPHSITENNQNPRSS